MEKFNYKKWILEHKKILAEKVKPGSEKQDKLPDGRTVTRYTAVSSKGKETPMISYDDNLEGPGDKKDLKPSTDKKSDDKEKTDGPKKFPFIGPKGKEFEVKMFDISPKATKLYTELQNITFKDKPELLIILKSAAIQHERLFIIGKTVLDDKSASEAQIKCAENVVQNIKKFAREMDKENEHNYLQAHIDKIKKIHKENPREDKDDDCPDTKDLNNKDSARFRLSKQSTTYGPTNPAPTYSEGLKEIAIKLGYLKETTISRGIEVEVTEDSIIINGSKLKRLDIAYVEQRPSQIYRGYLHTDQGQLNLDGGESGLNEFLRAAGAPVDEKEYPHNIVDEYFMKYGVEVTTSEFDVS